MAGLGGGGGGAAFAGADTMVVVAVNNLPDSKDEGQVEEIKSDLLRYVTCTSSHLA